MLGGPEGLRGLCSIKAVTEDRFFKWIRTSIPVPVGELQSSVRSAHSLTDTSLCSDYPLPPRATSWGFLKGLVGLAYGDGVWTRAKGMVGLAKAGLGL